MGFLIFLFVSIGMSFSLFLSTEVFICVILVLIHYIFFIVCLPSSEAIIIYRGITPNNLN